MEMVPVRRGIRWHLIRLIFASVLPVVLFAAAMVVIFHHQQREHLQDSFRDVVRALGLAVDEELRSSIAALEALATSPHFDTNNMRAFQDEAQEVQRGRPMWRTINVFDRSGQQLLNLARPFGAALPFSGDLPDVRQVLDTRRPAVSNLFTGRVLHTPVVGIAVPVERHGELKYVLGARFNVASFTRVLSEGGVPGDAVVTLIDSHGVIMARTRGIDRLLGTPASPTFVRFSRRPEPEGSFEDVTVDGVPVYGAYARSALSGWTVGLGVSSATVDGPQRRLLVALAGGGLVFLLGGIGLAMRLGKQVAGGVSSLAEAARTLGPRTSSAIQGRGAIAEVVSVADALSESEERARLVVAHALDAVITIDLEGRITDWNPQAETTFGWPAKAVIGRKLSDTIIPPTQRAAHERGLAVYKQTGEGPVLNRRIELSALRQDGTEIPIELAITPMRVAGATVFSAFLRDISERKSTEQALVTSAKRLNVLHEIDRAIMTETAPVAIAEAVLPRVQELLGVPRAIVNLFDLESGEVEWLAAIGRRRVHAGPGVRFPISLMGDLASLARGEVQVVNTAALPRNQHTEALLASGVDFYMVMPMIASGELIGALSFGGAPAEFSAEQVSIAREIAAQLAIAMAQARLRERVTAAEAHYRGIFENAVEGIFRSTREGRFLLVNPAMARLYGYESPEAMLASVTDIGSQLYVDPEDRRALVRRLDEHGVVSRFENQARRRDGAIIWVSQSLRAVRDERDAVLYYEGNLEDITERKRSEAVLRQSEKLAAMSSLVAGVAHELNNPLAVVIGHSTLLAQGTDGNPQDRATKILRAAERCVRLVKNFLAIARQYPPERRLVQINGIVQETLELLAYSLRVDNVTITLDLARDLPPVSADPHQLQQVILNLVTNAHHAVRAQPFDRCITVETRRTEDGLAMTVSVADTGPGIPPEIRDRLFEPFFTTKPAGQGTGLGLSLCKNIVEAHGGTLSADNRPVGAGAIFTVALPIRADYVSSTTAAATPDAAPAARVLIIDDEPDVADVLREFLMIDNHKVDVASSGLVALERLGQSSYDLIISDFRMPGLSGPDLYCRLEAAGDPIIGRFVFITGDVLAPETLRFLERVGKPTLAKPFVLGEVRNVVLQILGPSRQP